MRLRIRDERFSYRLLVNVFHRQRRLRNGDRRGAAGRNGCGVEVARGAAPTCVAPGPSRVIMPILASPGVILVRKAL